MRGRCTKDGFEKLEFAELKAIVKFKIWYIQDKN